MDIYSNLSIIIPNYKEKRLLEVYARLKKYFPKAEIILSDDLEGKGKGWCLREGFKKSTKNIICFLDGDMDIHPVELYKILEMTENYDIIVGKRIYNAPFTRKILNIGYKFLIKMLFRIPMSLDTQSGLKIFYRYALPMWETNGFAYDVEIFSKIKNWDNTIKQVPIICNIAKAKSFKTIWDMFAETLKIKQKI